MLSGSLDVHRLKPATFRSHPSVVSVVSVRLDTKDTMTFWTCYPPKLSKTHMRIKKCGLSVQWKTAISLRLTGSCLEYPVLLPPCWNKVRWSLIDPEMFLELHSETESQHSAGDDWTTKKKNINRLHKARLALKASPWDATLILKKMLFTLLMCSRACGPTPDKEGTNVFILIKGVNKVFSNQFGIPELLDELYGARRSGIRSLRGNMKGRTSEVICSTSCQLK